LKPGCFERAAYIFEPYQLSMLLPHDTVGVDGFDEPRGRCLQPNRRSTLFDDESRLNVGAGAALIRQKQRCILYSSSEDAKKKNSMRKQYLLLWERESDHVMSMRSDPDNRLSKPQPPSCDLAI
jgi:hypothetical protein